MSQTSLELAEIVYKAAVERHAAEEEANLRIIANLAELVAEWAAKQEASSAAREGLRTTGDLSWFSEIDQAAENLKVASTRLETFKSEVVAPGQLRQAATKAALDDAARRLLYWETEARAAAMERHFSEQYSAAIQILISLKAAVAGHQVEIESLNHHLPDGLPPILDGEARARDWPPLPKTIVSDEVVECWAYSVTGQKISESDERKIVQTSETVGKIAASSLVGTADAFVHRKKFRRVVYLPATRFQFGARIADMAIDPLRLDANVGPDRLKIVEYRPA